MEVFGPLFLTIAVSIDSLGVGVTYGLRRVRFEPWSLAVIGICTLFLMGLAMLFGRVFNQFIPDRLGSIIGALILIGIGGWHTLRYWKDANPSVQNAGSGTPAVPTPAEAATKPNKDGGQMSNILTAFRLPYLGIMVQILQDPMRVDADASKQIEVREALILGLALGMDAFGAGFGAAVAGFSFFVIPLVAVAAILFLVLGCMLGHWRVLQNMGQSFIYLPGLLLMGLGLIQLL